MNKLFEMVCPKLITKLFEKFTKKHGIHGTIKVNSISSNDEECAIILTVRLNPSSASGLIEQYIDTL